MLLEDLFKWREVDIAEIKDRLEGVANELGLPLGDQKRIYNSRLAHELSKWAEMKNTGDEFHNAAFHAYFAKGKNIGKIPVLMEIARSIGLSVKEAEKVLVERSFRDAVDSDWSFSRSAGVMAVPTLLLDKQSLVGAQPYVILEKFMRDNNVRRRNGE